jgi:Stress responsive A/B Barrel Domain
MICHLVFYRMKQGTSEEETDRLLGEARLRLPRLPGVKNLRAGTSVGGADKGYAAALAMEFEDAAALESYRVNPDHQKFVIEIAGPMVEEVWRYDFQWK